MTEQTEELAGVLPQLPPGALGAYPQQILDSLPQCVFLKDRRLRYLAANPAFCASLGRPGGEVIGADDFALYSRALAETYRAAEARVVASGASLEGLEERTVAGKLRTVQAVKTPVRGPDGAVTGVLGVFWDVTDQRRLEEQLRQGQKTEAVAQLAGGIAHDFNNLLTGILGNLALIKVELSALGPPDAALIDAHVGNAERVGRRAAELVRQLLGFARRLQGRPEPLDLNEAAGEAVRALRAGLGPQVSVAILTEPDLWPVQADQAQMQRVLTNLCLNARDAMPHGGRLTVDTANVVLDGEAAREHLDGRPGEFVCVTVSDSGEGIAAEVLPRVFDPFFTTKDLGKGTGLGLAMAFGIVKEHHGWITGRSRLGSGSRFEVYLPRGAAAPRAAAHESFAAGDPLATLHGRARGA